MTWLKGGQVLAVKLHKKPSPGLSRGSYLVPIFDWESGRIHIRRWIKLLEVPRRTRRPNITIRYASLCTIPDDHPMALYTDWIDKSFYGIRFQPLREVERSIKQDIAARSDAVATDGPGGPSNLLPEVILGAPLPPRCLKWTRRIQLLYERPTPRGTQREHQRYEGHMKRRRRLQRCTAGYDHEQRLTLEIE